MKKFAIFVLLAFFSLASTTKMWKREGAEEFLKGSLRGVSLSWDGVLSPSFKLTRLPLIKEDYLLSILKDGRSFWVGTGHDGKLYRIDSSGKVHLVYDAPELDIYALAKDDRGNVYFATSPRGKIYRVSGEKVEEFFDPEERFIWKLVYKDGFLYAATGKPSALYRINPQGAGEKILEVPDSQILDFVFGGGKIYLATSGKGRVYLYDGKSVHLLWESPYEEVSSLAVWKGKVYAATQGKVKRNSPSSDLSSFTITVTPKTKTKKLSGVSLTGKSEVYQIDPVSRKAVVFWENPHKYVSSLRVYRAGLYASTGGDKARVFQLMDFYRANLLEEVEAKEIRALYPADRLYFLTSAPTGIYRIEATRAGGYYLSDVLDASGQARWGNIYYQGSGVEVYTRSGNASKPDSTWEGWSPPVFSGEKILSSPARYLQVKIKISPGGKFSSFRVYYHKMNLSPRISQIKIYPPGVVFKEYSKEKIRGLPDEALKTGGSSAVTGKRIFKKGFRTVMWKAFDPDGDKLVYTISIKGSGYNLTLEKNWKDNYYAFDSTFLPDGKYKMEITASDLPSNPPQEARSFTRTSPSFLVDNTPPEVAVERSKGEIRVVVKDGGSGVKELLYTTDGKLWLIARPDDGICDSKSEKFTFKNIKPIALRAVDFHGNTKTLPLGGK